MASGTIQNDFVIVENTFSYTASKNDYKYIQVTGIPNGYTPVSIFVDASNVNGSIVGALCRDPNNSNTYSFRINRINDGNETCNGTVYVLCKKN